MRDHGLGADRRCGGSLPRGRNVAQANDPFHTTENFDGPLCRARPGRGFALRIETWWTRYSLFFPP